MRRRLELPLWVGGIVALVSIYVMVSWLAFSIRNPDMTQTRVFLNFWKAMTWQ